MTDVTATDAWAAGVATARHDLAAYAAAREANAVSVPVSYTAAVCSILASPHLLDWPTACREWLWAKCTRWPRGMEEPHHAISRADLRLD